MQRLAGRGWFERVDPVVGEEPLSVSLGLGQHAGQVRQAGAGHGHREAQPVRLVGRPGHGGDVGQRELLGLVDQQEDSGAQAGGGLAQVDQQLGQVQLEIPRVGPARFGIDGDPEAHGPVGRRLQRERLEHPQRFAEPVRGLVPQRGGPQ